MKRPPPPPPVTVGEMKHALRLMLGMAAESLAEGRYQAASKGLRLASDMAAEMAVMTRQQKGARS